MGEIESCIQKYQHVSTQKYTHTCTQSLLTPVFPDSISQSSNKAGDDGTSQMSQVGSEQNIVQSEL